MNNGSWVSLSSYTFRLKSCKYLKSMYTIRNCQWMLYSTHSNWQSCAVASIILLSKTLHYCVCLHFENLSLHHLRINFCQISPWIDFFMNQFIPSKPLLAKKHIKSCIQSHIAQFFWEERNSLERRNPCIDSFNQFITVKTPVQSIQTNPCTRHILYRERRVKSRTNRLPVTRSPWASGFWLDEGI